MCYDASGKEMSSAQIKRAKTAYTKSGKKISGAQLAKYKASMSGQDTKMLGDHDSESKDRKEAAADQHEKAEFPAKKKKGHHRHKKSHPSGQDDAILGRTSGRPGGHAGHGLEPTYGV
jgi:hypothetical protein